VLYFGQVTPGEVYPPSILFHLYSTRIIRTSGVRLENFKPSDTLWIIRELYRRMP
jgi:hypothetical protein